MTLRVEEFAEFHSAMNRARELARNFNEAVSLTRSGSGWSVQLPLAATNTTPHEVVLDQDDEADFDDHASEAEDEYYREVVEPIMDEISDDQDSFARSEEEGWFYED